MRKIIVVLMLLGFSACSGKPTPIPEADTADAKVFASRCGSCHVAPHPKRLDFASWRHMLGVMESQMQHNNVKPLSEDEQKSILSYLERHSR